jgi:hypothetical protein
MTSTNEALQVGDYTQKYAPDFNKRFINSQDSKNNLWNVSMASALYVGNISSANSLAEGGIIQKQPNGYYGTRSNDTGNMEYYIEENVMKRANESSD